MPLPVITSVALNPALDRTLTVPGFQAGATNRVTEARLDPGGKGINVARVLRALDTLVQVMGFLGEANGRLITNYLDSQAIPQRFVSVAGQVRVNLKLVDPNTGALTEVNDLGFQVEPAHLAQMTALVGEALTDTHLLVLAGSLPAGVPATYYRDLTVNARAAGVPVILDADGEALRAALTARPFLIKPNQAEAERLLGRPLTCRTDVIQAAQDLLALGPEVVVISCGGDGAVLTTATGAWWATPPAIQPASTVGAGDSMVAALARAFATGLTPADALRLATATGTATASLPGTQVANQALVEQLLPGVSIKEL